VLRAVDVAILLPSGVHDLALRLSAALPADESQGLRLDATHLPHITLAQAFIEHDDIAAAAAQIDRAVAVVRPIDLAIIGTACGHSSVSLVIAATAELRALHVSVMQALSGLEQAGGDASAFFDGDGRERDVSWVAHFREASSFDRFRPHVTLGHAGQPPSAPALSFSAVTLALCQLGRFCTCREVLREWTLS
jgi:hypothetical protein